jgi:hypothetical protein
LVAYLPLHHRFAAVPLPLAGEEKLNVDTP